MSETAEMLNLSSDLLGEAQRYAGDVAAFGLVVDGDNLAALVGVNPRTIRDLAQRGLVVKVGTDRYDLTKSLQSYASHLREMAAGRGDEASAVFLTAERARLAKEQADHAALKNAALRRELVPASEVAATWGGIVRQVRSRLLAVPARVRQGLAHLTARDVDVIDAEIRRALEELSEDA
ncbi:terminase small subunit [Pannonibacter tanglangensis]|nr:terminase small subunit [Pannonibacter sp. XCT-34]